MKKSFLIIGAIVLSTGLMAISYFNKSELDDSANPTADSAVVKLQFNLANQLGIKKRIAFFFEMGPRFRSFKKQDATKVTDISSFLSESELENLVDVRSVRLRLFDEVKRYTSEARGTTYQFNQEQMELLQQMDYSTNFVVDILGSFKNVNGQIAIDHHTPHLTIVPEVQAEYLEGMGIFYQYLRENAKKEMKMVDEELLGAGVLYFTVSVDGKISKVDLKSSSKYPELDAKVIQLMEELPGKWKAAENEKGEKVEQELVLNFGRMGC